MLLDIAKGEHYFYILKLNEKYAFKIGVSKNNFSRVKQNEHNYGGINYKESLIAVSPIKKDIEFLEDQILNDYKEYSVADSFKGMNGFTEMLSGECLQQVVEDVQLKADRFPNKKMRIIRNLEPLITSHNNLLTKEGYSTYTVPKSIPKIKIANGYKAWFSDVLINPGERIPFFTFPNPIKNIDWNLGPRYYIQKGCYISPRVSNTLRTINGRKLLALFIKNGSKLVEESFVITCGEAADGLDMPRNIQTLAWIGRAACDLWCGAIIDSAIIGCKGINYIKMITLPSDLAFGFICRDVPENIWDLELILKIRVSLFDAMQKWFYAPDIQPEVWNCVNKKEIDFFSKVLEQHNNTKRVF